MCAYIYMYALDYTNSVVFVEEKYRHMGTML